MGVWGLVVKVEFGWCGVGGECSIFVGFVSFVFVFYFGCLECVVFVFLSV